MLSPSTIEIVNNITKICEKENIRLTIKSVSKAGLINGLCSVAGGFLGGKMGLTLGGLAGTALNSYFTPGFMTLTQIIQQMTDDQKTSLANLVRSILQRTQGSAVLTGILANDSVKAAIITAVVSFVQSQGLGCRSSEAGTICRKVSGDYC